MNEENAHAQSEWHPGAALAALIFMSLLFAAAGLANLLDLATVRLSFFGHIISSQNGIRWWVAISLSCFLLFGYLLYRLLKTRNSRKELSQQ